MNVAALISTTRARSGDDVAPYFASDAELIEFANEAEREACRRARLIVDSTTTATCSIAIVANTKAYALDPRVVFLRRVKLTGGAQPLARISYKDLDKAYSDWESESGPPTHHIPDFETGKFRPWPTPNVSGTANLTVVRMPLQDMTAGSTPEINPRFHLSLVSWMLYRFYSKPDSDIHDEKAAKSNLAIFESEFGKTSSAVDEQWISTQNDFTDDEGVF